MADLCTRFGGFTTKAWSAVTPERGGLPEGVFRLHLRPDPDSRLGFAVLNTLEPAYRKTTYVREGGLILLRLLSFYWPLFTTYGAQFNDSGGTAPPVGPVLSPEKCRYLIDCWRGIDMKAAETVLAELAIFPKPPPAKHHGFGSAADLLGYLGCYAEFLTQAIDSDSFYCSYDGTCL